ncbi:MAG TPA: nucleotidyltransferase family protein [Patescibacteria group bacterium]|nr:nucleotidyltransferase family protein [Patescibacteria group bacterium]
MDYIGTISKSKLSSIKSFGNSMYPLLLDEDIVYLKKTTFSKLRINDIVAFKKSSVLQTHRIIYKTTKYVITKGDNNLKADGKVYTKQIIGKVYKIKRIDKTFNPEAIYLLQSTLYFNEILRIKYSLEQASVDYVFLKGLPLYLYYTKTFPKRIYSDCDLLIDKNDFIQAVNIFKKNGYKKIDTALTKTHARLRDKITQVSYYKKIGKFIIAFDLHSEAIFTVTQLGSLDSLYSRTLIDLINHDFLAEKRYIVINKERFPLLSLENQIIFLCHHLFRDNFKGAYKYEFLNNVIRDYLKDKKRRIAVLGNKIHDYKLENIVYPCFLLLNKYYDTNIPKAFLRVIKPDAATLRYIVKSILTVNIFDSEDRMSAGENRFRHQFFLSPYPFLKRFTTFIQPKVIYSILWVLWRRVTILFFTNIFKNSLTSL